MAGGHALGKAGFWRAVGLVLLPIVLIAMTGPSALGPDLVADVPGPTETAPTDTEADPPPRAEPNETPAPTEPTLEEASASRTFDADGNWLRTQLDVPFFSQLPDMPTGCEATSVAMLLAYAGAAVTKDDVAAEMPYSDDPDQGFQGNPYSEEGGVIYPPALLGLVAGHVGTAADLTGATWDQIKDHLEAGRPVVVWFVPYPQWSHTVVVTGYSATQVFINDPYGGLYDPWGLIPDSPESGKDLPMDLDGFLAYWAGSDWRALTY
jgi:uncharacterized protein YvpB